MTDDPADLDVPLSFTSDESSTIRQASYDPDTRQLTVEFRDGRTYDYPGIDPDIWLGFLEAGSKGAYFATQLRPLYAGRKRG